MTKGKWIPVQGAQGKHSKQAHADMPEGTFEREMSKEGFFGPAAFFHHANPPTGWSQFEGPLRPRAFDLTRFDGFTHSPWDAPVILHNKATEVRMWHLTAPMNGYARNGDGDTLLFIHEGHGDLWTDWGHLQVEAGDYVYLPRGAMFNLDKHTSDGFRILTIEATNTHFTLPDRGLLGPHALFDPAMLQSPVIDQSFLDRQTKGGDWKEIGRAHV